MSAGARRWCDDLGLAWAFVECGGERHAIAWRRGKLVLEDHDLLAERALIALGSDPPRCIELLDAWKALRDAELIEAFLFAHRTLDPADVLDRRRRYEEAIERADQRLGMVPRMRPEVAARFRELRDAAVRREQRLWAITLIETLPPPFRRRLALATIVRCARQWEKGVHREGLESTLHAIASPLLERSVRRWRRNLKPYASVIVSAQVLSPGERPSCAARIDNSGAHVVLKAPLAWFTGVWARGLALIDDCFVLAVVAEGPGDGSSLHVVAVRFERAGRDESAAVQAPAILARGASDAWSLHWA
jgi:hypothetical protein